MLDKAKQHDDIRLLNVAIKKRWDIPEEFRQVIIDRLKCIVNDPDDELALKAIAQVTKLESQNQTDEHKQLDEFSRRVLDIANRLGIKPGVGEIGIGIAGSSTVDAGGIADDSDEDNEDSDDEGTEAETIEAETGTEAQADIDESEQDGQL